MGRFGQTFARFLRFLRGQGVTTERDRIRRAFTILALAVLLGVILMIGVLEVTTPRGGPGVVLAAPTATLTPTATTPPTPTPTSTPVPSGIPRFSHIFQIVLENTSYTRLIGNPQAPYFNSLAHQYGLATQFYAVTHPSLPNYFALTAGTTFGVGGDCAADTASCQQKGPNLADAIEQSGRTWAAYFQSMPAPCDTNRDFPYTIHVDPFVYYTDIVNNQQRCQSHVLPYNQPQFFASLSASQAPDYVWISPDLNHDMHEGYSTIAGADQWLAANVAKIIASPVYQDNSLIIITFDEGKDTGTPDTAGCCGYTPGGGHIATLLISPLVKKGFKSSIPETEYNLLATIEAAWGLPMLGQSASATPMKEFFTPPGG